MCRVTMGHLRVTVGHPRVTIGHLRVIMGHFRLTIGYLEANTTELHPKVRQTCPLSSFQRIMYNVKSTYNKLPTSEVSNLNIQEAL